MNAPFCSECGRCRLEGPDRFGNWDLDIKPGCPIHDRAPAPAAPIPDTDPYDKVQDAIAEQAHDGKYLTNAQIVRSTLDYEREHSHLPLGRHPFGLPPVSALPRADTPSPAGAPSLPPAGVSAGEGTTFPAAA